MGMRIALPWMESSKRRLVVAAARDPIPISRRRPLIAMKAVHALWSRMKNRLVSAMIQDRPFTSFRGRASTDALSSSKVGLHQQCYLS